MSPGNKPLLIKLNAPITAGIDDVFMIHVLPILISRSLIFSHFLHGGGPIGRNRNIDEEAFIFSVVRLYQVSVIIISGFSYYNIITMIIIIIIVIITI